MATITFFRQARQDGGIRTGIDIDQNTGLSRFETGDENADPVLLWYVDVRIEGKKLPRTPESARKWLIEKGRSIRNALLCTAEELTAGIDVSDWPIQRHAPIGTGFRAKVVCCATRRIEAQQIADVLRDVAEHWKQRVEDLSPNELATL